MNKYIKIFLTVILFCGVVSCDRDAVFEKEQYKNVFAIVSGDDNVHRVIHDYRESVSTGYISASLGGSNTCEHDIVITLVEDADVLEVYNHSIYQEDRDRYVLPLRPDRYYFDDLSMTIRAGETKASLPVYIKPEGLSPDSVFYIPMRVDTYNSGELNMEKGTILYEVRTKNWWCSYNGTTYVSRGLRYEPDRAPTNLYTNKIFYPFGPAFIRIMPGSESERDGSGALKYRDYAMMLQISDTERQYTIDGIVKTGSPVTIRPYDRLDMTQITQDDPDYDPEYPNIAISSDDDGYRIFKTLLLHYRFVDSRGIEARIQEEIRMEYIEDPKNPRFLNQ